MEGDLSKTMKAEMRAAGEIVAAEARQRFTGISPRSAAGFRPVVRARGTSVEQRYRRTTGKHPSFGSLQMRTALIPALDAKQGEVIDHIDAALGRLVGEGGF